jgi:RND superfamily putative drug exporter
MDHHAFILRRVRKVHERGMSTAAAGAHALKATAGVVTGAAIVMVAVFATFATLEGARLSERWASASPAPS